MTSPCAVTDTLLAVAAARVLDASPWVGHAVVQARVESTLLALAEEALALHPAPGSRPHRAGLPPGAAPAAEEEDLLRDWPESLPPRQRWSLQQPRQHPLAPGDPASCTLAAAALYAASRRVAYAGTRCPCTSFASATSWEGRAAALAAELLDHAARLRRWRRGSRESTAERHARRTREAVSARRILAAAAQ